MATQSSTESEFLEAFEEYTDIVSKANRDAIGRLIEAASDDNNPTIVDIREAHDDEDTVEEHLEETRRDWIADLLGINTDLVSKPQDVLDKWDTIAPIAGLNGAPIERKDPEGREQTRLAYLRGLSEGLKALGGEAAQIDLPEDFLILLRHADRLVGHKWELERDEDRQVVFFQGMLDHGPAREAIEGPDKLKGAPAYASADFESLLAGFQTGQAPEGSCYCIYGRQVGSDEGNSWYYYINEGQFGTRVFSSMIDVLEWYQDFNVADEDDIEEALNKLTEY